MVSESEAPMPIAGPVGLVDSPATSRGAPSSSTAREGGYVVTVLLVLRPLPTAGSYLWHCEDETDGRKERPPALLVPPTVLTQPRIRRITHQITGMRQLPTKLPPAVE